MSVTNQGDSNGQGAGKEDPVIMLRLLSAIGQDSAITQRSLSGELGIALGLANAYLKRCAKKGLIKVRQVPLNRYAYYLTPKGFSEKSRLTAEYLKVSFNFFRDARAECGALLEEAGKQGRRRIALVGAGELAEIAVLSTGEIDVDIVCVIDGQTGLRRCAGKPVVGDLAAALHLARADGGLDGFLITDTLAPQRRYDRMVAESADAGFPAEYIMAPRLLRITHAAPAQAMAAAK
jgi:DNA-binding MarR family transcriptional regulator